MTATPSFLSGLLRYAGVAAIFVAGIAGAAAETPPTLAVGIYPSYPPLDMRDPATGQLTGFDVALSQDLASRMGLRFEMKETAFAQMIASVQTGRIGLFFNGMDDTAPRRELIGFVDYLSSGSQFVIRAADSAAFPDEASLCGHTVAGSRSTDLPGQVAEWSKAHCAATGKPPVVFLGADNNIDARSQLKQGRVEAIIQDSLTVPYVAAREPGTYAAVGAPFEVVKMGIGVAKDDKALQERLRTALQSMIADGTYAALLKTWNLPASSGLAGVTINDGH